MIGAVHYDLVSMCDKKIDSDPSARALRRFRGRLLWQWVVLAFALDVFRRGGRDRSKPRSTDWPGVRWVAYPRGRSPGLGR